MVAAALCNPVAELEQQHCHLTTWVKPNGPQAADAGIVFNRGQFSGGGTYRSSCGLKMDVLGGLNLAYSWDGDPQPVGWDSTVGMNDGQWNFVALIVRPDRAILWVPKVPIPTRPRTLRTMEYCYSMHRLYRMDPYTNVGSAFRAFNARSMKWQFSTARYHSVKCTASMLLPLVALRRRFFADPQPPAGTFYAGIGLR